jgi:hypothetical protein
MTAPIRISAAKSAFVALCSLLLSGCGYDYLNHTDRVSYAAGDAVHANLERETKNPSKRSMYRTGGLGKNGSVIPRGTVSAPAVAAAAATAAVAPAAP